MTKRSNFFSRPGRNPFHPASAFTTLVLHGVVGGAVIQLVGACGSVGSMPDAHTKQDSTPPDATRDASRICDPASPFDAPVPLVGFAAADNDEGTPYLSADELTLYYRAAFGAATDDLYVAHRMMTTEPFGLPSPIAAANSSANDSAPTVGSDGLTLIFHSDRSVGEGNHIYVSTRTSTLGEFGAASKLGGVNSATPTDSDIQPFLTADETELWFVSTRTGGLGGGDLYNATRSGDVFTNPTMIAALNSTSDEGLPTVSADRLTVYFASTRPGGQGSSDVWTSHRSSTADGFPPPVLVPEINSSAADRPGWLSPDNCRLYIDTGRSGNLDIYVATRHP